ncbi:MAG TPA: hypothetical protein VIK61_06500 [Acidimicrobiia bacterium]
MPENWPWWPIDATQILGALNVQVGRWGRASDPETEPICALPGQLGPLNVNVAAAVPVKPRTKAVAGTAAATPAPNATAMAVPPLAEPVADDGWAAAYAEGTREVNDAWTDAAALERTVTLPWATFPGAAALASYTSELTTHTWDLATAIGVRPEWDEQVLAVSLASIREGLPAEGRIALFDAITDQLPPGARSMGYPFGEAIAVPDDAAVIDQLVAYTGRRSIGFDRGAARVEAREHRTDSRKERGRL